MLTKQLPGGRLLAALDCQLSRSQPARKSNQCSLSSVATEIRFPGLTHQCSIFLSILLTRSRKSFSSAIRASIADSTSLMSRRFFLWLRPGMTFFKSMAAPWKGRGRSPSPITNARCLSSTHSFPGQKKCLRCTKSEGKMPSEHQPSNNSHNFRVDIKRPPLFIPVEADCFHCSPSEGTRQPQGKSLTFKQ